MQKSTWRLLLNLLGWGDLEWAKWPCLKSSSQGSHTDSLNNKAHPSTPLHIRDIFTPWPQSVSKMIENPHFHKWVCPIFREWRRAMGRLEGALSNFEAQKDSQKNSIMTLSSLITFLTYCSGD
jgi:hypothetical protein